MLKDAQRAELIARLKETIAEFPMISEAYPKLEADLLSTFEVQRVSIFQRRSHHRDLVARYKTGKEFLEIKVPVSTMSIAGYVAMTQQPLVVNDPYNDAALQNIHFKLKFEKKYDRISHFRTTNVVCVPLMYKGVLLGVMQLINKNEGAFDSDDLASALEVADLFGSAFKYELGGVSRPFDYLIHTGAVEAKLFEHVTKEANVLHISHNLTTEYKIPEKQIGEALAIYHQVPYIAYLPDKYNVMRTDANLNVSYLKRNNVAVLNDAQKNIYILMFEPDNSTLLMELESALGAAEYQLAFSMPSQIMQYLGERTEGTSVSEFDDIIDEIHADESFHKQKEDDVLSVNEDEPAIVRLVTSILVQAKRSNASDIHIDPEVDNPTMVRMRIDGVMKDVNEIAAHNHAAIVARIKIMSGLNIAEKRLPQDGKLAFNMDRKKVEVRVATVPTIAGEGVVMRILAAGSAMSIDKLDLSERNMLMCKSLITLPHGILLVVGATGSGKTTTLHAILGELNTPDKKIWTAEDPVEITQHRLKQVQVNSKIGFTFANALRAFLRADPDVILIGEMRDKETAFAAVEASLTGHLVLSTLHTNSAPETITRLLDLGIDPINFSDACTGILAQRLVRRLCTHCKESYEARSEEIAYIKRQYGEAYYNELKIAEPLQLYRASGCSECNEDGYKGRIGIHELLPMSVSIRSMIYKQTSIKEIKEQALEDGMRTLSQDAIVKMLEGKIDIHQALKLDGSDL